jgi:hypothetical protein
MRSLRVSMTALWRIHGAGVESRIKTAQLCVAGSQPADRNTER